MPSSNTVACSACGLNLGGIPTTRRVLVTCPSAKGGCGGKFYYPHTERSAIAMRCAQDGRHFTAFFKREVSRRKFTIERMALNSSGPGNAEAAGVAAYNADAYDFSGFYCPGCGFTSAENGGNNICQCGRCSELVCQALVYDKLNTPTSSVRWFICHPECGHQGPITRVLQEYQASRNVTVEKAAAARLANPGPAPLKLAGR